MKKFSKFLIGAFLALTIIFSNNLFSVYGVPPDIEFQNRFLSAVESNDIEYLISLKSQITFIIDNKDEIVKQHGAEFSESIQHIEGLLPVLEGFISGTHYLSLTTPEVPGFIRSAPIEIPGMVRCERSALMDDQMDRPCCKMCSVQALMTKKFDKKIPLSKIFEIYHGQSPLTVGLDSKLWHIPRMSVYDILNDLIKYCYPGCGYAERYRACERILRFRTIESFQSNKWKVFNIFSDVIKKYGAFEMGAHFTDRHSIVVSNVDEFRKTITFETYGRSIEQDFNGFFDCLLKTLINQKHDYISIIFLGNIDSDPISECDVDTLPRIGLMSTEEY